VEGVDIYANISWVCGGGEEEEEDDDEEEDTILQASEI
jgi:hypothetical protein